MDVTEILRFAQDDKGGKARMTGGEKALNDKEGFWMTLGELNVLIPSGT